MARVTVELGSAQARRLPAVSARSGKPADGYAAAGPKALGVLVPLTQTEFDRVMYLRRRQKSAVYGGFTCLALGLAMARFPFLLPLGAVIALLSAGMWVVATLAIKAYLPGVDAGLDRGTVELSRVHKSFVEAVRPSSA